MRRRRPSVRRGRRSVTALLAAAITLWFSASAWAQLDPLLFLKRVPPTVIVVVDTSLRMLEDGNGNFYDPNFYSTTDDPAVMPAFPNIDPLTTKTYRRIFRNLTYTAVPGFSADRIVATPAVWDPGDPLTSNAPSDIAFHDQTRYTIARRGIAAAVSENAGAAFRWGLIRLRQSSPAWRVPPNCDRPVASLDPTQSLLQDTVPCNGGGVGQYGIYAPGVTAPSYLQAVAPAGTVMVAPAAATAGAVLNVVNRPIGDNLGLVPGGQGGVGFDDRPLSLALDDAKAAAIAAMNADSASNRSCRNTVVVLITSGRDDGDNGYTASRDPAVTAGSFLALSAGGVTKRVPIMVVGVMPQAADEAELQAIATNSGGRYRRVTTAAGVAAAINHAVQTGFSRAADFEAGTASDFLPVSPIVGTVNLKGARDATGAALPNTDIQSIPGGQPLPQRSNVLITAGFSLPGFEGRIRAFRTYRPEEDATKPGGWKFVNDGTRLWPDLDGRPQYAGLARTPADPDDRNIYTYLPDGMGGGSVVP
ncbi:MAG TPA: hypothetical protein VLD67_08800, partial [Vicinamibacterales bacterium]|nr:hypothetical protein [Vicinamibacterales bacterium]